MTSLGIVQCEVRMEQCHACLVEAGYELLKSCRTGSVYYRHIKTGRKVRVSDHYFPHNNRERGLIDIRIDKTPNWMISLRKSVRGLIPIRHVDRIIKGTHSFKLP